MTLKLSWCGSLEDQPVMLAAAELTLIMIFANSFRFIVDPELTVPDFLRFKDNGLSCPKSAVLHLHPRFLNIARLRHLDTCQSVAI